MLFTVLIICQYNLKGQPFALLGEEYQSGDRALTDINQRSNIYTSKPIVEGPMNLYHTPFFVFKSNSDGTGLDVRLLDSPGTIGKKQVIITILNSPVIKKEALVSSIIQNERSNPVYPDLKNISVNNLITLAFKKFKVSQSSSTPQFSSYENDNVYSPNEIDLIAELSEPEANDLAEKLRKNQVELQFDVYYEVNAKYIDSRSDVKASGIYLYDTKAAKDIVGNSGAFTWRADVPTSTQNPTVGRDDILVNRRQKEIFMGRIKKEVEVVYRIQNPNDMDLLSKWQEYFSQTFKSVNIDINSTNFAFEIANLSAYGLDPNEIRPDEINTMVNDISSQFSDESRDIIEISANASANGSFCGIEAGGSASGSYNRDEMRKRMESAGWKFELNGTMYVPKSLEVYILNKKSLREEGVFNMSVSRESQSSLIGKQTINTRNYIKSEDYVDFNSKYEYAVHNSTPIGAILPFAGPVSSIPRGWRLCNGDYVDIKGNEQLFNVLQHYWCPKNLRLNGKLKLPDLQGQFLRGVSYNSGIDPDVNTRIKNGVGQLNEVGSSQKDEFKLHYHKDSLLPLDDYNMNWDGGPNVNKLVKKGNSIKINTSSTGGNETRPKNYYVNYIIRVN